MWYGIWQCHDMVDYMFEKSTVHIMWFGIITGDMTYENYLHGACVWYIYIYIYIYMRVIPKIWSSIWHDAIIIIKHNKTIYNIFVFYRSSLTQSKYNHEKFPHPVLRLPAFCVFALPCLLQYRTPWQSSTPQMAATMLSTHFKTTCHGILLIYLWNFCKMGPTSKL